MSNLLDTSPKFVLPNTKCTSSGPAALGRDMDALATADERILFLYNLANLLCL
jgi:hypothetical protein